MNELAVDSSVEMLATIGDVRQTTVLKTVNEALKAGWKLIAIANGQDDERYPLTVFTLGWPGEPGSKSIWTW